MGLTNKPYVGSVEQRKEPHPTLCVCVFVCVCVFGVCVCCVCVCMCVREALASLRHAYMGFLFLDLKDNNFNSRGHLEPQQRNRAPLNW